VELEPVAEDQKAPKEHAAVKFSGALRKRHRGRNLAAECCQKLKERTRGNCGSQKKLGAAHRRMTQHAGVAQHKGQREQHCKRSPQRMNKREGTVEGPGRQKWN
jgi:hypothetical protein